MTNKPINLICPRCSNFIPSNENPGAYPGGISRYDNETELCSSCCTDEAMVQFLATQEGLNPTDAVHPVFGQTLWDTIPNRI